MPDFNCRRKFQGSFYTRFDEVVGELIKDILPDCLYDSLKTPNFDHEIDTETTVFIDDDGNSCCDTEGVIDYTDYTSYDDEYPDADISFSLTKFKEVMLDTLLKCFARMSPDELLGVTLDISDDIDYDEIEDYGDDDYDRYEDRD